MAGRKPKPTVLKELEGNPGKRKLNKKEPIPGKGIQEWIWNLKKLLATDRPMTTALFLLRCTQIGLSIRELDLLTIGMVNEMFIASRNDEVADKAYCQIAGQAQFDVF